MNKTLRLSILFTRVSILSLLLFFFMGLASEVLAHKVTAVSVVSRFNTKGLKYRIELAMDIYPSKDPAMNDKVSPQQAANFFSNEALILFFDDKQVKSESRTELIKDPDADPEIEEQKVKVMVTLFGEIPKDAEHFSLRVSPETTAAVVMVTFKDGKPGRRAEVLYPGEFSSPVSMATVIAGDPFGKAMEGKGKGDGKGEEENLGKMGGVMDGDIMGNLEKIQASRKGLGSKGGGNGSGAGKSMWDKAKSIFAGGSAPVDDSVDEGIASLGHYTEIGVRSFFSGHFEGLLLVLCIFFFSKKSVIILRQVVVFTVAYSMGLLLAVFAIKSLSGMLGVTGLVMTWGLPLGIVFLASENLFTDELKWWRQGVIAISGFLLGIVFSVTLSISGMQAESAAIAFGGFYLGLGLAQLLVLVLCSVLAGVFWRRSWYRSAIAMPVSMVCAGLAVYWMIM
ncbi:MAG: HupE/UreJ family protein [Verrucomicrobiota bacterium]